MDRRSRSGLIGCLLSWLLLADATAAPPADKVAKLCALSPNTANPGDLGVNEGIKAALRERGYVEGRHFTWHSGWGEGTTQGADARAREFVHAGCTVILAGTEPAVAAAQRATRTVPILMMLVSDPVGHGFVHSLGRPAGNITGMTTALEHLLVKRVEIGMALLPSARIGVLASDSNPYHAAQVARIESYGRARSTVVTTFRATQPADVERAFGEAKTGGIRLMVVLGGPPLAGMRAAVARAALGSGIGTAMPLRSNVEAGGLFNYSLSLREMQRDVSLYLDKILNGQRPADLPVLEPSAFELVINTRTAQALGVTVPAAVLMRADQLIE